MSGHVAYVLLNGMQIFPNKICSFTYLSLISLGQTLDLCSVATRVDVEEEVCLRQIFFAATTSDDKKTLATTMTSVEKTLVTVDLRLL